MPCRRGEKAPSSTRLTAEIVEAMELSDGETFPDTATALTSFMGVPIIGSPPRGPSPRPSTSTSEVVCPPPENVIDLTIGSVSSVRFPLLFSLTHLPVPQSSSSSPMQGVLDLVQEDWIYKVPISSVYYLS